MAGSSLKWRVPNKWNIVHSDGEHIGLEVSQDGNTLVGSARRERGKQADSTTGVVTGSVDGNEFHLMIYWPHNAIEDYLGTVGGDGSVEGTKVDKEEPATIAHWRGDSSLTEWR